MAKTLTHNHRILQIVRPLLAMSKVDSSSLTSLPHRGSRFHHLAPITVPNTKARVCHLIPKSTRITAMHRKVASNHLFLTPTPLHQGLLATHRSSLGNLGGLMRM